MHDETIPGTLVWQEPADFRQTRHSVGNVRHVLLIDLLRTTVTLMTTNANGLLRPAEPEL